MISLSREIVVPIPMSYIEIAQDIAHRIETGEYPAGGPLPSYRELAALYSVSVRTAGRAYELLRDQGIARGSKGRGMFAADAPV